MKEYGEIEGASSGGTNLSTLQGDETGIVTISWDGKYEEIEIKSTKE